MTKLTWLQYFEDVELIIADTYAFVHVWVFSPSYFFDNFVILVSLFTNVMYVST